MATPTYTPHNWVTRELISRDLLNNIEQGIVNNNAGILALEASGLKPILTGSVNLTNTLDFPFSNSKAVVSMPYQYPDNNYIVVIKSAVANDGGCIGTIEIPLRTKFQFQLSHTGSASSVTVEYAVYGGA